jgi:hypothetical protein
MGASQTRGALKLVILVSFQFLKLSQVHNFNAGALRTCGNRL